MLDNILELRGLLRTNQSEEKIIVLAHPLLPFHLESNEMVIYIFYMPHTRKWHVLF